MKQSDIDSYKHSARQLLESIQRGERPVCTIDAAETAANLLSLVAEVDRLQAGLAIVSNILNCQGITYAQPKAAHVVDMLLQGDDPRRHGDVLAAYK